MNFLIRKRIVPKAAPTTSTAPTMTKVDFPFVEAGLGNCLTGVGVSAIAVMVAVAVIDFDWSSVGVVVASDDAVAVGWSSVGVVVGSGGSNNA